MDSFWEEHAPELCSTCLLRSNLLSSLGAKSFACLIRRPRTHVWNRSALVNASSACAAQSQLSKGAA